jgi:hypothetical protein
MRVRRTARYTFFVALGVGGLMKLRNRVAGAVASACVLVWAVTASASTVLSDGDFSGTITVGSHSGDPLGSAGGSPCGLCGNPLGGLFASVSYPAGAGTSISDVGFIDGSLAYNPGFRERLAPSTRLMTG